MHNSYNHDRYGDWVETTATHTEKGASLEQGYTGFRLARAGCGYGWNWPGPGFDEAGALRAGCLRSVRVDGEALLFFVYTNVLSMYISAFMYVCANVLTHASVYACLHAYYSHIQMPNTNEYACTCMTTDGNLLCHIKSTQNHHKRRKQAS